MQLRFNRVSKAFGPVTVFKDLEFCVPEGDVVCIRTGVLDGGTTLLKMMAGLLSADSGEILLGGKRYEAYSDEELFDNVTMCFEEGGLLDVFTNYNNIVFPLLYHLELSQSEINDRIERICSQLYLMDSLELEPCQLNDVQKRLLNLAKALVIEPKVIIVDELQSGMSDEMRDHVLAFLMSEQRRVGFSLIMSVTAGDRIDFANQAWKINNYQLEREAT